MNPTDEQEDIAYAFGDQTGMVIEAAAGSGKTTTLRMLAEEDPLRKGLYLAYNRAIRNDARSSFPSSVDCMTSHGLAHGPVARARFSGRQLGGPRQPAREVAQILGIREPLQIVDGVAPLAPQQLARLAMSMVTRFCYSDADEVLPSHLPVVPRFEGTAVHAEVGRALLPYARKAWADLSTPTGRLRWEHDHYLKLFQLSRPTLPYDYLLVDEAQDLNPAVRALVEAQTHAQVVLVGDRCQQLYAWRGAVDAMSAFAGQRFQLTQSFRFGLWIAAEANKWLELLGADLRVRGLRSIRDELMWLERPAAVLCRTNGGALGEVITALNRGRKVALVGGGGALAAFARAAQDLKAGRGCDHPELLAFTTWAELQDYVDQDDAAADLKVFVTLVDRHGPEELLRIAGVLVAEDQADTVVSTAHKAKGREWESVSIADDFREPADDDDGMPGEVSKEDGMLAYVAVTRAKRHLHTGGLAWVDRHLKWAEVKDRYQLPPVEAPAVELVPSAPAAEVGVETPPPAPDGPPFPIGSRVRYHSARSATFTVQSAYLHTVLGWVYTLKEPHRDVVHSPVSGDRLQAAEPVGARS